MGVDVDKARRDQLALGVDFFLPLPETRPISVMRPAGYRDIGFEQFAA